jgi:hypothetical protein
VLAVGVHCVYHLVVFIGQRAGGLVELVVPINECPCLGVHFCAALHHLGLKMAVRGVSTCELLVHELHEGGHAVFCFAQLVLQSLQVLSIVIGGVLLHRELDVFNVYWAWDGFNEGREVPMGCGRLYGCWGLVRCWLNRPNVGVRRQGIGFWSREGQLCLAVRHIRVTRGVGVGICRDPGVYSHFCTNVLSYGIR